MKILGKALANKIATVIVLVLVVGAGLFWWRQQKLGKVTAEYDIVVKRFSKKSELVVADAAVSTTANKTFEASAFESWPEWSKPITKFFVGRDLKVDIPVKTEFKLALDKISKKDIQISNNVLTFKRPITVRVDSQQEGESKIASSSGLVDRVVDAVTAGEQAQKFFEEKSQDAIHQTSEVVMNDEKRQGQVADFAEEALENLLNLHADEKWSVRIVASDLEFVNVDPEG